MNTTGKLFTFTSFGESHGKGVGGIIDGCPAGVTLDEDFIRHELRRRRPGQSIITTPRHEEDEVEFLSGIFNGKSTGAPIAFVIWNKNQQSEDYDHLKAVYRPSHADYTYQQKYGIRDHRGGGRSSARVTAAWVAAGAVAKLILKQQGVDITAYTSQVGHIAVKQSYETLDLSRAESNIVRCPDPETAEQMIAYIDTLRQAGNSVGGTVNCVIRGVPAGWGEPLFDKVQARLGAAMLSINAVHGFDYGKGFEGVAMTGAEQNDPFVMKGDKVSTLTNHSGGIQGGISNGEDIYFRVLFKAVSTISQKQTTLNTDLQSVTLEAKGRHDPCVLPRAVPIVEAMAALTMVDLWLMATTQTVGNRTV